MPSRIILPRFSPNSATPPPPVISLRAAFLLLRAPRIQAPLRQEMCRCPEVSRAAQLGGDIAEGISRFHPSPCAFQRNASSKPRREPHSGTANGGRARRGLAPLPSEPKTKPRLPPTAPPRSGQGSGDPRAIHGLRSGSRPDVWPRRRLPSRPGDAGCILMGSGTAPPARLLPRGSAALLGAAGASPGPEAAGARGAGPGPAGQT